MLAQLTAGGLSRALPRLLPSLGLASALPMRAMATEGTNKPVQRDATADTDSATASGMAAAAQAAAQTDTGSGPSSASYDAAEAAGAQAAAGTTGYASTSAVGSCYDEDYGTGAPRLVVFGGNGFVGSRVCQEGLAMGAEVTSINRSGRPRHASGDWANRVDWVQGDALDPGQGWRERLRGATGVVSTLGAFGSNEFMYKICGEANMRVMDVAAEVGVPRFAFISVADYKFPMGWHAQDFLLKGYFQGKRDAEAHMRQAYPDGGVALRPGFIYGTRAVGSRSVPLGLVGAPLKAVLSMLPTRSLANIPILGMAFVPPVSVETVARAAVRSVLDPSVPPGVLDVWDIERYGK